MHVIIIGAGPAGITAAGMITDLDSSVECTVLTAENLPPYSPPVMYDHFINGFDIFWKGKTFEDFAFCPDSSVISVDFERKLVTTARDRKLHYDKLIIASGSSIHSPIRGVKMSNVYNFKSLTVASELIEQAKKSRIPQSCSNRCRINWNRDFNASHYFTGPGYPAGEAGSDITFIGRSWYFGQVTKDSQAAWNQGDFKV